MKSNQSKAPASTNSMPRREDGAQEFHQIQKFVAACRRQWPGAMIVLRPNEGGPPDGADAPPNPEAAPGDAYDSGI
jgi:hypothetical protein